jgi:hypothetical protein
MLKRFTAEGRFECGLDALVAGKRWAYVAVTGEDHPVALGVAIEGEAGYHPVPEGWAHAANHVLMQGHVDQLNAAEGLDRKAAAQIVASTMRPQLQ